MNKIIFPLFLISIFSFAQLSFSMSPLLRKIYLASVSRPIVCPIIINTMNYSVDAGRNVYPIQSLLDSIGVRKGKRVPLEKFKLSTSYIDIIKKLSKKLYQEKQWLHVDPTPGQSGFCQLVAARLANQIDKLRKAELNSLNEEEAKEFTPLIKAYLLQEKYSPKDYNSLDANVFKRNLLELGLIDEETSLSNAQANMILRQTKESFINELRHSFNSTSESPLIESMELALEEFAQMDHLLNMRCYDGTPDRTDIFSVTGAPSYGGIYRKSSKHPHLWKKLNSEEIAQLIEGNDTRNILQVHFEMQREIQDNPAVSRINEKPLVKSALKRNREVNRINGIPTYLGLGHEYFCLKDFIMGGVNAINNLDLTYDNPSHPACVPCHFSIIAGIGNWVELIKGSVFTDHQSMKKSFASNSGSRDDYQNTPLQIVRFISYWRNKSPHDPMIWRLIKKFKGFDIELGIAYKNCQSEIDPEHSFFVVKKLTQEGDSNLVKDNELIVKVYKDFIDFAIRPLTKPSYLYPQARFLLKQAKIEQNNIDELLEDLFIADLLRNI